MTGAAPRCGGRSLVTFGKIWKQRDRATLIFFWSPLFALFVQSKMPVQDLKRCAFQKAKMSQQIKASAARLDDLSWLPNSHVVEGEK